MTKQAIDIKLDFLRTLFCETKPKTKEDFKLLNTIKESIIKLNERKLMCLQGELGTFKPVKSRLEKMREKGIINNKMQKCI